jgi:hypothetical protein
MLFMLLAKLAGLSLKVAPPRPPKMIGLAAKTLVETMNKLQSNRMRHQTDALQSSVSRFRAYERKFIS